MPLTLPSLPQGLAAGSVDRLPEGCAPSAPKRELRAAWATWMPQPRLNGPQLCELANEWRKRSILGDPGAEAVAQALELVAETRPAVQRSRIQAVGQRITDFMQLN